MHKSPYINRKRPLLTPYQRKVIGVYVFAALVVITAVIKSLAGSFS